MAQSAWNDQTRPLKKIQMFQWFITLQAKATMTDAFKRILSSCTGICLPSSACESSHESAIYHDAFSVLWVLAVMWCVCDAFVFNVMFNRKQVCTSTKCSVLCPAALQISAQMFTWISTTGDSGTPMSKVNYVWDFRSHNQTSSWKPIFHKNSPFSLRV